MVNVQEMTKVDVERHRTVRHTTITIFSIKILFFFSKKLWVYLRETNDVLENKIWNAPANIFTAFVIYLILRREHTWR